MQVPPFSLSQQIDDLGVDLEEALLEVLRSGQYIGGPQIKRFEEAFAASVGCEHAVGCNSGTDALILALRGLGIGAGDEVITCSFSFFATSAVFKDSGRLLDKSSAVKWSGLQYSVELTLANNRVHFSP